MLEEMRSEYDQTKAAFGVIVKAAIAELELECGETLKQRLREAGLCVHGAEWAMVRHYTLDHLFLTWLCSNTKPWLYAKEPCWFHLPQSAVEGMENLLLSANEDNQRRGGWMDKNRTERIQRGVDAVKAGWSVDEAVVFVKSREEWEAVTERCDLTMDGKPKYDA